MTIARLPFLTSVHGSISSSGVSTFSMGSVNCIFTQYPDGRKAATQRYPINIYDYAGANGNTADSIGRGVYFWNFAESGTGDNVQHVYFVNNDTIYEQNYLNPVKTISAGRDPLTFLEVNNYLIVLDPENNEAWYAEKATPFVFDPLHSVANWPFTGGRKMAGGGAILNGTLYIMDTDGNIWNSEIDQPDVWDALWFIEASRSTDSGVFLTSHHDQVVAISSKTIEFFYDAGNPTGSPLQRREDIFYNVGSLGRKRVYDTGDTIFFLGAERTGTIAAYVLNDFNLSVVSDDSINYYLNNVISRSSKDFIVSGGIVGERKLFYITSFLPVSTTSWDPQETLVFDSTRSYWTFFETTMFSDNNGQAFPVISNSERGIGLNETLSMFSNGDVFRYDLTGMVQDSLGYNGDYFEDDDYIEYQDDYVLTLAVERSESVEFVVYTPEFDADSYTYKFLNRMTLAGTVMKGSVDDEKLKISWSDDIYKTFSPERDLDTQFRRSLTRCGKFKRRAFKVRYTGLDRLLIESLEVDVRRSDYA